MKYLLIILSFFTAFTPQGLCSMQSCCNAEVVYEKDMSCDLEVSCCSPKEKSTDSDQPRSSDIHNCDCCAIVTVFPPHLEISDYISTTFADDPQSPEHRSYAIDLHSIWIPPNVLA